MISSTISRTKVEHWTGNKIKLMIAKSIQMRSSRHKAFCWEQLKKTHHLQQNKQSLIRMHVFLDHTPQFFIVIFPFIFIFFYDWDESS